MATRQTTFLDYDGFLEKFKAKKTTDDCYTPANVYEAAERAAATVWQLSPREREMQRLIFSRAGDGAGQ